MEAQIVKINPEKAKQLLDNNTSNRKVKKSLIEFLTHQMKSGLWKQNGESIVIDKDGIIKDGQHRLHAILKADFCDYFVLVTDVDSDTFETIDTGLSRTLQDVFYVNGYDKTSEFASITNVVFGLEKTKYGSLIHRNGRALVAASLKQVGEKGNKNYGNNEKYSFFKLHEQYITLLLKESVRLYQKETVKVCAVSTISGFIHMIRKFRLGKCDQITEFMEELLGINTEDGSAPNFVYKRLLKQKTDKSIKYDSDYINTIFARAWNDYQMGVKIRSYNITKDLVIPKLDTSFLIFED